MLNRYTIIDEADEMLGEDWDSDLQKLMAGGGRRLLHCRCKTCHG